MDADQLLRDGDLDGARSALVETVRSNPADARARMFLFQLLAVAGEWDKAHTHLEALARHLARSADARDRLQHGDEGGGATRGDLRRS